MDRTARATLLAAAVTGGALVLGVLPAAAGTSDTGVSPQIQAVMDKPQYEHGRWGILSTRPDGTVTTALDAGQMFIPGSNAKLFTETAVWDRWGPDTRFRTPVHAVGARHGKVLAGRLVLVGSGDLSLGGRVTKAGGVAWRNFDHADANAVPGAKLTPQNPLKGIKALARQVRESGLRRVRNVAIDDRLFHSDMDPQPTPVMINDNLIDLVITPRRVGRAAKLTYRPHVTTLRVHSQVRTVPASGSTDIKISGSAPGTIRVRGTITAGSDPLVQVAPIADPASFARTAFIQALRRAGVHVVADAGGTNPAKLPAQRRLDKHNRVAQYVSPPWHDYAKLILKVSLNIGANLGVCLLAVKAGSSDCEAGFAPLRAALAARGVDTTQLVLADGRGGDPADRATPVATVQLLRSWVDEPDFAAFRACLPILGVDGSLADVARDFPARGKVFAKTGTMAAADPLNGRLVIQAKALGGFYQDESGQWQSFQVVVDDAGGGTDITPALTANEDVGEVAAWLWTAANPTG